MYFPSNLDQEANKKRGEQISIFATYKPLEGVMTHREESKYRSISLWRSTTLSYIGTKRMYSLPIQKLGQYHLVPQKPQRILYLKNLNCFCTPTNGVFLNVGMSKKAKMFLRSENSENFFWKRNKQLTKINMGQKLLRKWILLDVFLKSCAYVLYNNRMDSCGFFCHILRHCIIFLQTDKKLEKSKSSCLFMSQKVWQNKKRWTKRSKIASKRRSDLIVSPDIYLYLYFFIPIYW